MIALSSLGTDRIGQGSIRVTWLCAVVKVAVLYCAVTCYAVSKDLE